jgi:hypothetical protein
MERRKYSRNRCLLGARVAFNGRSSTMSCSVLNHSEDGALLRFGETPYIPELIEIVLNNRKTLVPAQVVWRHNNMIGIAFPRGQFMSELKQDAANSLSMLQTRRPDTVVH